MKISFVKVLITLTDLSEHLKLGAYLYYTDYFFILHYLIFLTNFLSLLMTVGIVYNVCIDVFMLDIWESKFKQ